MPTASDCGSCASAPMIGPAARTVPGMNPARSRAGRGSVVPLAHTSFSARPGSGMRDAARSSAGVDTTTKSPATLGKCSAIATPWNASRCPPIVAAKSRPCERATSGETSAGIAGACGAITPTMLPAPGSIATSTPFSVGVTSPPLPRHVSVSHWSSSSGVVPTVAAEIVTRAGARRAAGRATRGTRSTSRSRRPRAPPRGRSSPRRSCPRPGCGPRPRRLVRDEQPEPVGRRVAASPGR